MILWILKTFKVRKHTTVNMNRRSSLKKTLTVLLFIQVFFTLLSLSRAFTAASDAKKGDYLIYRCTGQNCSDTRLEISITGVDSDTIIYDLLDSNKETLKQNVEMKLSSNINESFGNFIISYGFDFQLYQEEISQILLGDLVQNYPEDEISKSITHEKVVFSSYIGSNEYIYITYEYDYDGILVMMEKDYVVAGNYYSERIDLIQESSRFNGLAYSVNIMLYIIFIIEFVVFSGIIRAMFAYNKRIEKKIKIFVFIAGAITISVSMYLLLSFGILAMPYDFIILIVLAFVVAIPALKGNYKLAQNRIYDQTNSSKHNVLTSKSNPGYEDFKKSQKYIDEISKQSSLSPQQKVAFEEEFYQITTSEQDKEEKKRLFREKLRKKKEREQLTQDMEPSIDALTFDLGEDDSPIPEDQDQFHSEAIQIAENIFQQFNDVKYELDDQEKSEIEREEIIWKEQFRNWKNSQERSKSHGAISIDIQAVAPIQCSRNSTIRSKVIVIGNSGIGKSQLLQVLCNLGYNTSIRPTEGLSIKTLSLPKQSNIQMDLCFWDFSGYQDFLPYVKLFIKETSAIILAFDINNIATLNILKDWINILYEHSEYNPNCTILVSTKHDLLRTTDIPPKVKEEIQKFQELYSIKHYFETSAQTNLNVNILIRKLNHIVSWPVIFGEEKIYLADEIYNEIFKNHSISSLIYTNEELSSLILQLVKCTKEDVGIVFEHLLSQAAIINVKTPSCIILNPEFLARWLFSIIDENPNQITQKDLYLKWRYTGQSEDQLKLLILVFLEAGLLEMKKSKQNILLLGPNKKK
jgi:small GTP-binding protein